MKWLVDSSSDVADPVHFLSKPLASLSLKDEPETSSSNRSVVVSEFLLDLVNLS